VKRVVKKSKLLRARKVGFGKLRVFVTPPQATVLINNKPLRVREKSRGKKLRAGNYRLAARMKGYEGFSTTIVIKNNVTENFPITLNRMAKGKGGLHIFSNPWAEIFIEGKRYGITPTKKPISLTEGKHIIMLRRKGFLPAKTVVAVEKNETTRINLDLKKE